jgi:MoaA/NifB/PqqE/SkfB family radical SAM enzyme
MCVVTYSKNTTYGSKDKVKLFDGRPKWGYVEITAQCAHRCGWCYGGFNHQLSDMMSLEDFEKVVDKLEEIGIKQLTFAGGEPTDHPDFEAMLAKVQGRFIINIVSHGDWSNSNLADTLKKYQVNQVQFNYQGQVLHDKVHGINGAFERLSSSIKSTKANGIEVVCSMTIGAYNLERVEQVFIEMSELGVDRIRVWEATGLGNKYRRDLEVKHIFDVAQKEAAKLGYNYVQSYDPLVEGNVNAHCPALSKLVLWVNVKGKHIYCGAVPFQRENPLSDLRVDSADQVLQNQQDFVSRFNHQEPFCMARQV